MWWKKTQLSLVCVRVRYNFFAILLYLSDQNQNKSLKMSLAPGITLFSS